MSDLQQRIIGAFYFVPLVAGIVAGPPYISVAIFCLQALMAYEVSKSLINDNVKNFVLAGLFLLTMISSALAHHSLSLSPDIAILVTCLMIGLSIGVAWYLRAAFEAVFVGVFLLCLSSLSWLITMPNAVMILVSVAVIITAVDISAYFVGRAVGGRKLAPSISPGKTVSGAIGGLLSAIIMALLLADHISFMNGNIIIIGLIIGVLAQAGDLYESAFKRRIGIKDSGSIIPGHGGLLDRFDGYLFIIPLLVFMMI